MFSIARRTASILIIAVTLAAGVPQALAGGHGATPPATTPAQIATPDANKIVDLVRGSLLTLNDAILTGNFTVLRDVGAPGFRETNSAARLSQAFSDLASRGIDLTAVATMVPQLAEAPSIDPKTNMLHIKGSFPGNPTQIDFDLLFQPVGGRWRLFGLSVQPKVMTNTPVPSPPTQTETTAPKRK